MRTIAVTGNKTALAKLSGMIEQLTGSEFDMEGLAELRKMLGGLV